MHRYLTLLLLLFPPYGTHAEEGENRAREVCAICHAFPDADLLSRDIWLGHVLPEMGARLGFQSFQGRIYIPNPDAPDGIYADAPMISPAEWKAIIEYYTRTAPERLPYDWPTRRQTDLFSIEMSDPALHEFPTTTAVHIDVGKQQILAADAFALGVETYDKDVDRIETLRIGGVVSKFALTGAGYWASVMGPDIGQREAAFGMLIRPDDAGFERMATGLHRPVDLIVGDVNSDGLDDAIIAEFGTHRGGLRLLIGQADGTFLIRQLLEDAGVSALELVGETLWVLIAQGDERIVRIDAFATDPVVTEVARFPPVYGSSSLQVIDLNLDGYVDLLLTTGDNADFSPEYKPYHGVHVLIGQPDGTFARQFYPLDGATSAVAADFDLDGDLDIAAIAYYARTDAPLDESLFMLLINEEGQFQPAKVAGLGRLGRFVAMSAGDIDGDGDTDIALANMAFGPYGPMTVSSDLQKQWLAGPAVVLLRNELR